MANGVVILHKVYPDGHTSALASIRCSLDEYRRKGFKVSFNKCAAVSANGQLTHQFIPFHLWERKSKGFLCEDIIGGNSEDNLRIKSFLASSLAFIKE